MYQNFWINNRNVGVHQPCFIIAEAGINHNGDLALAKRLIDEASQAGSDAVKFQTFKPENLVSLNAEKAEYQKRNDNLLESQFEMLKKLELTADQFKILAQHAKKKGIIFLSTAFDNDSLEVISRLNVPVFKIASGEITNFPFLKKVALKKKPIILSTGMSTLEEVREAVTFLKEHGCRAIILLHCTTSYPAPRESVNLRVMDALRHEFHVPVGYSDHTEGIHIPIAAVARGACLIEKHFTLDRTLPGPDHAASLEPDEFKQMVSAIREIESALGDGEKKLQLCEVGNRVVVRKSIVAAQKISSGSIITEDMLAIKRPGTGIEPKYLNNLIGKSVVCAINKDTVITWDMIQ